MWFEEFDNYQKKDMIILSKEYLNNLKNSINDSLNNNSISLDNKLKYKFQLELIKEFEKQSVKEFSEIDNYLLINSKNIESEPYLEKIILYQKKEWNPKYDSNKECECGHSYYRHFDSYEEMDNVGCKYCGCCEFKPKI